MNVHPSILDHAKFQLFKRELKKIERADAAEYLLRLWSHCQGKQRGENWGKVGSDYVEAIAQWDGNPGELWQILTKDFCGKSGWVHTDKRGNVIITAWNEHNAFFITSWNNGKKGGRPKKTGDTTRRKPAYNQPVIPPKTSDITLIGGIGNGNGGRGSIGAGADNPPPAPGSTPSYEAALAYCVKMGMDYTPEEVRAAWLGFEGTKNPVSGQWRWGKGCVTDWRAVFESRLADNRERKTGGIADFPHKKARLAQLKSEIEEHPANEKSRFYDPQVTSADKAKLKALRDELTQLNKELGQ